MQMVEITAIADTVEGVKDILFGIDFDAPASPGVSANVEDWADYAEGLLEMLAQAEIAIVKAHHELGG